MATIEITGTVRAFDVNGNDCVNVEVRAGDMVKYKRNGRAGVLDCRVLGFETGAKRPLRLQPVDREGHAVGRAIATRTWVESVWRDGKRVPLPAPFVSVVKSYEVDGKWALITVDRPGFRDIAFNNLSPAWTNHPYSAGDRVLVEARQLAGDLHVTWFITPHGDS